MRLTLLFLAILVPCVTTQMRDARPAEAAGAGRPLLEEFPVNGSRPPKIEDFVARQRVDSVVLSPGGTTLVVGHMAPSTKTHMSLPGGKTVTLSTLDGLTPQLSVFELPSLQIVKTHQTPVAFFSLADIRWVSESRLLSQWQWPRPGFRVDWEYLGDIHVLDVERDLNIPMSVDPKRLTLNSLPVELRPYLATIISKAEGPLSVVDARTDIHDQSLIQTTLSKGNGIKYGAFELKTDNGALKRVAALPIKDGKFLTGANHRVELVTATNSGNGRVVYYLPPDLRARERSDPQVSHWQLRVTSNVSYGLEPIAWTGMGEEYYALDGRNLPVRSVVVWNAEHDTRQVLYSHPEVDMDAFSLDPAGRPWMFSGSNGYPVYWYPDPAHPLARLHQALVQRLPHERIDILNSVDDYSLAVARISSGRRTPVYVLVDADTVRVLRSFQTYPQLSGVPMAPVDAIEYRATDGSTIQGYLTTPLDSEGKPRRRAPLIVIEHEGPQGKAADYDYDFERQLLAFSGYAVLQVNHRGLRGRGAAFGDPARWHNEGQQDIVDGTHWAAQQGVADPDRVCFFGSGYGASAAIAIASSNPGVFKCVVAVNGAYDAAITASVKTLKSRVLLMQQRHEPDFPIESAYRLRVALQETNNTPQWEVMGPDDVGFLTPAVRAGAYGKILKFLDQQLGR
jgi:dienelactone hydrolase